MNLAVSEFYDLIPESGLPRFEDSGFNVVRNINLGLGDTIMSFCFSQDEAMTNNLFKYSDSPHFSPLLSLNPNPTSLNAPAKIFEIHTCHGYNFSGGHIIDKLRKVLGLPKLVMPKAFLGPIPQKESGKVILSFDTGIHQRVQKAHIHPRARELYDEHKAAIQKFINESKMRFVEVGIRSSGFSGVENKTGVGLAQTIKEVTDAELFIGINSGPAHLAAAFNVRSIIVVNFPNAHNLYLPCLKENDFPDSCWLYPQNVHLHEDEDGELAPKFSYENLKRAIEGKIYPHF